MRDARIVCALTRGKGETDSCGYRKPAGKENEGVRRSTDTGVAGDLHADKGKRRDYWAWVLPSLVRHRAFLPVLEAYGLPVNARKEIRKDDAEVVIPDSDASRS